MPDSNQELIERFYGAFDAHDGETMASLYAPGARFSDPVFPDLRGNRPGEMWKMLTGASDDLRVELLEHEAADDHGSAHWRARYTFTQTGRPVVNDVRASFRFEGGLIAEHRDEFDFHRWARQALGPVGLLLGWTPIVRNGVRKKAAERLHAYAADG
jgi:ketosteroid isomerase-like protein